MSFLYRLAHLKIALRNVFRSRAGVFSNIYAKRLWRDGESFSGPGSSLEQTIILRKQLPLLLKEKNIGVVLDAPCGDLNWISRTELGVSKYIGADIVPDLIAANRKKFASDNFRSFICLDICEDPLPEADIIIIRDAWVHLSYAEIKRSLENLKRSKITWLLCTHFPGRLNEEILTGNWRPLNLQAAPFHFPAPEMLINEGCTEADGRFSDKSLGLWKISDL